MKIRFIKFNDNPHGLPWLPESKDYYPELSEFIAMLIMNPITIGIFLYCVWRIYEN